MSYLKSTLRLKLSKVRRLLQPFRISRPPAIDMEDDEEPKSKRPCVEGDKERDTEDGVSAEGVQSDDVKNELPLQASLQGGPRFAKRRKCILLMSYNGKGYMGMQK